MTVIKAEKRDLTGKKVKNLRKEGRIPAVVYGAGENGVLLQVLAKDFDRALRTAGESTLVQLEIGSDTRNVLIHDVSFDPIKDIPVHVDFLQVRMDKKIKAKVELHFEGEAPAAKLGGILVKVLHEIEVEALPADLPHGISVDLSKLENLEDKFTVADLKLPKGVEIRANDDEVLALIETPKSEEELKAEEEQATGGLDTIEVVGKKEKEEVLADTTEEAPEK